jgi:Spy/CpxP family protein refolding chaperone
MLRKLTLALVAAASLGAAALAPTAASASPLWHPHHHLHGHGLGFIGGGYGHYGEGCYRTRLVLTKFGPRYRVFNVCAW